MSVGDDILVVGGYGVVGHLVAAHLAARFPGRVVVAGRDAERATALSRRLGNGVRSRRLDVNHPGQLADCLSGVGTVMACVAQAEPRLLRAAVADGLAYTDIAPRLAFWDGADVLHAVAQRTGARVLLGAGLSPGISNLMAKKLSELAGRVESVETAILLSLGDAYGADSLHHVLESLERPFKVFRRGRYESATPFSEGARIHFPTLGRRTAYVFPWSDVVYYPKTLGVETAIGRLALDPPWLNGALRLLVRAGAPAWLERHGMLGGKGGAVARLRRVHSGNDHFELRVRVEASGKQLVMSLAGRKQAEVTAAGAFELCRLLAAGEMSSPGVWLPEQVVQADPFFSALERLGWRPELHR